MGFLCSICEREITRGWYCYKCYIEYRQDIESNQPWTRFLQNQEKRRRREPIFIYIGESDSGDGVIWQVENRKGTN